MLEKLRMTFDTRKGLGEVWTGIRNLGKALGINWKTQEIMLTGWKK